MNYRVFIATDVIAKLRTCHRQEQLRIMTLFDELVNNPYRSGDYVERDEIGRPIQVLIIRRQAVFFWADHAVKEVKIVDLKPAGA